MTPDKNNKVKLQDTGRHRLNDVWLERNRLYGRIVIALFHYDVMVCVHE